MKATILFGAGASVGCGGINIKMPLGNELFDVLQKQYPNTWGTVPEYFQDVFRANFEAGMESIYDADPNQDNYSMQLLLADMAVFFSKAYIINPYGNYYCSLIVGLQQKKRYILNDILFSTINYDCLLELAAAFLNIPVNHSGILGDNRLNLCKIHGSCNYISTGMYHAPKSTGSTITVSSKGSIESQMLIVNDLADVEKRYSQPKSYPPPAMAIYMKGKPVHICKTAISTIQGNWSQSILKSNIIAIVGAKHNMEDTHIWDYINKTKSKIYYCGGRNDFEKWQTETSRKDTFLGEYFEDAYSKIINDLTK